MPVLAAYGHSWIACDGASRPDRCLVAAAGRALGATVLNRGVGGSLSTDTAALVAGDAVPRADAYLLMTGLNDARLHGAAPAALREYAAALATVLGAFAAAGAGAAVVALEQPRLVDYTRHEPYDRGSDELLDAYNAVLRAAAGAAGALVAVPADWDAATMLADDTVHPNDRGHEYLAQVVVGALG
ncbi:SGNH/GDSL hydrolase family protein [Georgenia yuyongxinii]|uniref:SGNH/GDSL hydrolase family protein n=1 Tax=Georgenia yuyongxinii TaxID=2589797 RepID=A0A552WWZ8_9MICO|nr:SGNH/GDSL hydrolase family protein [Georgenia yuyongxinii]TRW47317.1 SGNH/GDSL hydrolase family protein [Georgenia yuyongxinii]